MKIYNFQSSEVHKKNRTPGQDTDQKMFILTDLKRFVTFFVDSLIIPNPPAALLYVFN